MAAGIDADARARTEVTIRGRNESMMVRTVADPTVLPSLLDLHQAPDAAKPQLSAAQARA